MTLLALYFHYIGDPRLISVSGLTFVVNSFGHAEMYPGFQIMGSSGPLLEKFGGPLLSFGGPANL